MSLVRVPDRMKEFTKWVKEVTQSAQLRFGSRASTSGFHVKRTPKKRRRRRSRTRKFRTRKTTKD